MGLRRALTLATTAAAVVAFALAAAYALGDEVISSAPTCASPTSCSYSASSFTITGGQVAKFQNATTGGLYGVSHNVTATQSLGGGPLFASKTISSGQTAAVDGTQYLAPGDYTFFCTIHGPTMSATLHVVGGSPLARPQLDLAIASGKLAKVRRTGKLKVRLGVGGSDAKRVALRASVGRTAIARKNGLSAAVGTKRAVAMKLSKAGRRALKGRRAAKVKLAGTVPFGSAAKAKRTLR